MKFSILVCVWVILASFSRADSPKFERTEIIYGRKFGTALTFDLFKPATANGNGVIAVISGGWFSSHDAINPAFFTPFLERGYTVFAVVHGSQPRFIIPEVVDDMHRAVRFIRAHSSDYGIKADSLGVFGASAGGHLSLTLGTQGRMGNPEAKDPVDRESSAVQAVACFFPPTDFLNYMGEDAVGVGRLKDFKPAFGDRSETAESRKVYGKEISPINFITVKMPPTLIIHGDADQLVPIQQAEIFEAKAKELGTTCDLVRRPGQVHGWPNIEKDVALFADWFDRYLPGRKTR